MTQEKPEGQQALIEKVLDKGICVKCGACVGLCPHFNYWDGQVVVIDRCPADTWRCLQYCPRAGYAGTSLISEAREGKSSIGPFTEIWAARSTGKDLCVHGQYGGVVSSLLIFAMKKDLIQSAVVTDSGGDGLSPAGKLARSPSEIIACSGSRYAAAGTLATLNHALAQGEQNIGVVGLPCQMEAIERMAKSEPDGRERVEPVKIKIGLFCTWALDYRMLRDFLAERKIKGPVKKYDIPPPPEETFMLLTEDGWIKIPLDEVRGLVQKGCGLCADMTGEWADISVGTVEGRSDWNTVIIRTETGANLFKEALDGGSIEVEELPVENLDHLREAASNKKRRAEATRLKA